MLKHISIQIKLIAIIILFCYKSYSQADIVFIDNYNYSIKTMAIMPCKLYVGKNGGTKDTTAAMEKAATIKKALYIQKQFYNWLVRHQKNSTVTIQDVDKTDSLLNKTKVSYDALFKLNEGALCDYLGVESLAYCDISMSNPGYDIDNEIRKYAENSGISIITGLPFNMTKANITTFTISIFENKGEMIWKNIAKVNDLYDTNNTKEKLSEVLIKVSAFKLKLPFL